MQLRNPDGTPASAFQCTICKRVWSDDNWAERCCHCNVCGKVITFGDCPECRESLYLKRRVERDVEDFGKAKKVNETDYKGVVFCEDLDGDMNGSGYFTSVQSLRENCADLGVPVPRYVWGTYTTRFHLDAQGIVESACDELHEDAIDDISGIEELQEILDDWIGACQGV